MSVARMGHGVKSAFHPGDWPLAAKVVLLCVTLSAALAVVLTVMGYRQASDGLHQQAEAAVGSDAQLVANTVDGWNAKRLSDVQAAASLPVMRRILEAGSSPRPEVESIAATAEDNSAATEEMSASAEEMSAQVQGVVASASSLSAMAEKLREAVASFRVSDEASSQEGPVLRRRRSDWEQPNALTGMQQNRG